jgi:hypothetical protein
MKTTTVNRGANAPADLRDAIRGAFREDSNTRRNCVRKTPCERWFWADACHYPYACEFARSEDTANARLDRTGTAGMEVG